MINWTKVSLEKSHLTQVIVWHSPFVLLLGSSSPLMYGYSLFSLSLLTDLAYSVFSGQNSVLSFPLFFTSTLPISPSSSSYPSFFIAHLLAIYKMFFFFSWFSLNQAIPDCKTTLSPSSTSTLVTLLPTYLCSDIHSVN